MARLQAEQKKIYTYFSDKRMFLIPDYQRPYAWGRSECEALWNDLFIFFFENEEESTLDSYFLGPIVTCPNNKETELIDGQQRITTIMLLLRAFYEYMTANENNKGTNEYSTRKLSDCIWLQSGPMLQTDRLRLRSEQANEQQQKELEALLHDGRLAKGKGRYTANYNFFYESIERLKKDTGGDGRILELCHHVLEDCMLLPIEADTQDMALTMFSSLNDRGLPLSDSDIFKAQLYRNYNERDQKERFMQRWRQLEDTLESIRTYKHAPMDDLFAGYMYYRRAKMGVKSTTRTGLRNFYEKDHYALLKEENILDQLELLADFLRRVSLLDDSFTLSIRILLCIILQAPNNLALQLLTVYFFHNEENGVLNSEELEAFLRSLIACILAYLLMKPGGDYLSEPIYTEMKNIVSNQKGYQIDFSPFSFEELEFRRQYSLIRFPALGNPSSKFFLTWFAFRTPGQQPLPPDLTIRNVFLLSADELGSEKRLHDSLGNQSIIEEYLRAKVKGRPANYLNTDGTIVELKQFLEEHESLTPEDIEKRNGQILNELVAYLRQYHLLH